MKQRIVYEPEVGDAVDVAEMRFLDGSIKCPAGRGVIRGTPSKPDGRYTVAIADRTVWLLPEEFALVMPPPEEGTPA